MTACDWRVDSAAPSGGCGECCGECHIGEVAAPQSSGGALVVLCVLPTAGEFDGAQEWPAFRHGKLLRLLCGGKEWTNSAQVL